MAHSQENKHSIEIIPKETQRLDLLDKYFKPVIQNLFKELKETMSKEWKRSMRVVCQQIENINKEV